MERNKLRHVAFITLLFCLAASALAQVAEDEVKGPQIAPEAEKVLRRASEFYAGLDGLVMRIEAVSRLRARGQEHEGVYQLSVLMSRPGRLKIARKGGWMPSTVIYDGEEVYTHVPSLGAYMIEQAPENIEALLGGEQFPGDPMQLHPEEVLWASLLRDDPYAHLVQGVTSGEYVGEEDIGDKKYHHLKFQQEVLDWEIWIAAGEEPLVHKIEVDVPAKPGQRVELMPGSGVAYLGSSLTFTRFTANPEILDSLFAFAPPPRTKKVDNFFPKEKPHVLLGKEAPQFQLELLDGGQLDVNALRDKVVILDFWATWCGPCIRALPILTEVAEAYKDKGVVFYAVNLREAPGTIRAFLKKHKLDFAIALDAKGGVANLYGVTGIPQTVIIGTDGVVESVHVGVSPSLRTDLQKELDTLLSGKSLTRKEEPEAGEE